MLIIILVSIRIVSFADSLSFSLAQFFCCLSLDWVHICAAARLSALCGIACLPVRVPVRLSASQSCLSVCLSFCRLSDCLLACSTDCRLPANCLPTALEASSRRWICVYVWGSCVRLCVRVCAGSGRFATTASSRHSAVGSRQAAASGGQPTHSLTHTNKRTQTDTLERTIETYTQTQAELSAYKLLESAKLGRRRRQSYSNRRLRQRKRRCDDEISTKLWSSGIAARRLICKRTHSKAFSAVKWSTVIGTIILQTSFQCVCVQPSRTPLASAAIRAKFSHAFEEEQYCITNAINIPLANTIRLGCRLP